MYKRILVPLDGSKLAEKALTHAESLATKYDATLVLLSVVESPPIESRTPADINLFQETLETIQNDLEQYLKGKKGEFAEKNIMAEMLIGQGPIVERIVDVAKRQSIDLVIIASHGRSGLKRVFFGSVTAGVLNRIATPILVIRSSEE